MFTCPGAVTIEAHVEPEPRSNVSGEQEAHSDPNEVQGYDGQQDDGNPLEPAERHVVPSECQTIVSHLVRAVVSL